jgi:hypothetical protein
MRWTPHWIEFKEESCKQKTSFQEETVTIKEQGVAKKEEYLEGRYNKMEQGKFSPVSTAEKQVTLKGTVDSQYEETLTTNKDRGLQELDKEQWTMPGSTLLEASWMTIA